MDARDIRGDSRDDWGKHLEISKRAASEPCILRYAVRQRASRSRCENLLGSTSTFGRRLAHADSTPIPIFSAAVVEFIFPRQLNLCRSSADDGVRTSASLHITAHHHDLPRSIQGALVIITIMIFQGALVIIIIIIFQGALSCISKQLSRRLQLRTFNSANYMIFHSQHCVSMCFQLCRV